MILPIACHTYLESYDTHLKFGLYGNHLSASYKASQFCWHSATACIKHRIWHLVLRMQIEILYSLAAHRVTRRASFGTLCPPCGMIYRAIRLPYLWYWPSFVQPVLISTPFSTYFVHISHAPYEYLQIPVCVIYYIYVHTSYLSRTPQIYLCKFFLAGVNFYRFNAKNWHFRQILREKVAFFLQI